MTTDSAYPGDDPHRLLASTRELARGVHRAQRATWFQRYDGIWLTAHGGNLNSAWLCYGERARLDEWRRTDEFEAWVFKAQMCMDDLVVCPGVTTEGIREAMERRKKAVGSR